jgi:predicted amidophosphoribosyltransferase
MTHTFTIETMPNICYTSIYRRSPPIMNQAIEAYHSVVVSPEFKEVERLRIKASHDEAQALHNAERRSIAKRDYEIVQNALHMNMPIDDVIKLTGLTREEVEKLRYAE